ncbi:hypothetical protein VDG1235_1015 [Verrucomicrobiia bacterium DG1235]|nr:hypothetical protein VDG1235_1015 [Verrucomicrobiae bacterium DG1235]
MRILRVFIFSSSILCLPYLHWGQVAGGLILPEAIGQPDYKITKTFSEVKPRRPLQMLMAPGDERYIFAVERLGSLLRIDLANPSASQRIIEIEDIVSDFTGERGFLSAAFHPEFPAKPYLYLYYTVIDSTPQGDGGYMRLSRVSIDPVDMLVDMTTEVIYIHQYDPISEHQGGTICFGPNDGYLYLGFGDGGKGVGARENTQQIDQNFFGAVIRIDVDEKPENLVPNPHPASFGNYKIPRDNPFVGATDFNGKPVNPNSVRTEFWAVGFRNPFRMRFDPDSGDLWLGDVGWSTWEELNRVQSGKNYGWPYFEADSETSLRDDKPPGFVYESPVWAYDHTVGNVIIVGRKYYGAKFPELHGKMMMLDFIRGILWAFDPNEAEKGPVELARHRIGLTDIMIDPRDGGIIYCGQNSRNFEKLERADGSGGQPPLNLSDIGAFDTDHFPDLVPVSKVLPYDINVPFWSDHAFKNRFVALPDGKTIGYSDDGKWEFPKGTVWIKHFEIESVRGDPSSKRNLETRFLVKVEGGTYGLSYRWNDDQSDAELVSKEGLVETFAIQNEHGEQVEQKWLFPSEANCFACHTSYGGHALAFHTAQLNREGLGEWDGLNQIDAMNEYGFFGEEAEISSVRPSMAKADDESASLTHRVRSYLQANCAQCHQPEGDVLANWDGRLRTLTREADLIHGEPVRGGANEGDALVTPGSPENSVLYQRISQAEGRMPPLASFELDQAAIDLVRRWIMDESEQIKSYNAWKEQYFGLDDQLADRDSDPDYDGLDNFDEFVLGTDPKDASSNWKLNTSSDGQSLLLRYLNPANRATILEESEGDLNKWNSVQLVDDDLGTKFPAEAEEIEVSLPLNSESEKLYRVRVVEP